MSLTPTEVAGALNRRVGDASLNRVQHAVGMGLDHAGDLLDRLEAAADRPRVPAIEDLACLGAVPRLPHHHRQLLQVPAARRLQGRVDQGLEGGRMPLRQPVRVVQPHVPGAGQPVVSPLLQLAVLRHPYLVHGVPAMGRDVELVVGQLLSAVGQVRHRRRDVGRPHVHRHCLDPRSLGLRQRAVVRRQSLLAPTVRHMPNAGSPSRSATAVTYSCRF